jgi:hypothetical protein
MNFLCNSYVFFFQSIFQLTDSESSFNEEEKGVAERVQSLIEPEQAHPGVQVPAKEQQQENVHMPRRSIREIWLLKRASRLPMKRRRQNLCVLLTLLKILLKRFLTRKK